jgi:hypothetical protein
MKNLLKYFVAISALLLLNSCDPFEERYITLALETELETFGVGPNITISDNICLSEEDEYSDNVDDIEEIKYVAAAYTTISASPGLRGTNLTLRVYQSDGVTLLFDYIVPTFVAADYINNPLEIELTQQEIENVNNYLKNHKQDNCFIAVLTVNNAQDNDGSPFYINGKVQFLTELIINI